MNPAMILQLPRVDPVVAPPVLPAPVLMTPAPNEPALASRPVVLLRGDHAAHLEAARWAQTVAAALKAEVVVVRVLNPRGVRANLLFPQKNLGDGLESVENAHRSMDARVRWQRRFRPPESAPAQLSLVNEGVARLGAALEPLRPRLVVMPASQFWPGDTVARLAAACGTPVLVARASRRPGRVVAATNLEDGSLPVLHQAAEWAHTLHWPLTFVHNLQTSPLAWVGIDAFPFVPPEPVEPALGPRQMHQLEQVAGEADADVTVTHSLDPVAGILDAAREAAAELLVVGTPHAASWMSRRVTARVVASAKRSVLVVPLPVSSRASRAEEPRTLKRSKS